MYFPYHLQYIDLNVEHVHSGHTGRRLHHFDNTEYILYGALGIYTQ